MIARACGAASLLALVLGCGPSPTPTPPKEPQTHEQLKGRLEAGTRMTNPAERSDAMKVIAEDAADAGAVEIVTKALDGINNPALRSDVAADCALKLAKSGDPKNATAIAERITNPAKRNEILGRIAKGE